MKSEFKANDKVCVKIDEIKKAIAKAEEKYTRGVIADHIVIFWGYSGTGKSTSIITLNGQELFGFYKDAYPIIVNKESDVQQQQSQYEGKAGVFIEPNVESGTIYPEYLPFKQFTDNQQSIIMWDTPGFGDTKGLTQILINTYFIHRIFNLHKQVKLIFTLNFSDLDLSLKGEKLQKIITTLTQTLKNFKDYQKCMSLLVTKAHHLCNKEIIKNLLLKNIQMKMFEKNELIDKFKELVEKDKICILINRQPQLQKNNTEKNMKTVTQDYQGFISQFYETITDKLVFTDIPHLSAPGMSIEQLKKWQPFVNITKKQIDEETDVLIQYLKKLIRQLYSKAKISDKHENVISLLKNIVPVKSFMKHLLNINETNAKVKDDVNQRLLHITNIFYFDKIESKQDQTIVATKSSCPVLENIKNKFIIVDFLSTLSLAQRLNETYTWISYNNIVYHFFLKLKSAEKDLKHIVEQQDQKIRVKIQEYIKLKLRQNFKSFQKERTFTNWINNIKTVPSIYLKTIKYNKSSKILDFLARIDQVYKKGDVQCYKEFEPLKKILIYNQQEAKIDLFEAEFINQEIKVIQSDLFQIEIDRNLLYKQYKLEELDNLDYEDYRNKMEHFASQNDDLNNKVCALQQEKSALQKEMNKLATLKKDYSIAVEKMQTQKNLNSQLSKDLKNLNKLKGDHQYLKQSYEKSLKSSTQFQYMQIKAKAQIVTKTRQIQTLKVTQKQLQDQLSKEREQNKKSSQNLELLKSQNEQLKKDKQDLTYKNDVIHSNRISTRWILILLIIANLMLLKIVLAQPTDYIPL